MSEGFRAGRATTATGEAVAAVLGVFGAVCTAMYILDRAGRLPEPASEGPSDGFREALVADLSQLYVQGFHDASGGYVDDRRRTMVRSLAEEKADALLRRL